jgi:branched-chain amino acid transport system permease protein
LNMNKATGITPAEGTEVIRKKVWLYVIGILVLGLLVALPHIASAYAATVIFILFVYVGYAEGWNIMSGLTGYVNFGYSLFAGIAGLSASIVAFILGMVMLRLRGSYFAIGMLALLLGIQLLYTSKYLSPITRGGYGFPFIEPMSFTAMYYSAFVIALVSIFTTYKIITSGFGARLLAIREDEEAAGSVGINATANKITAFCISAFFGGLMASVHVAFQNYIEPHSAFNIQWTIVPIVMVLLGGPGSVWGPVIGAVILTFVEEFLWSYFTQAYMMIYGVVMVLLVLLMPGGIIEWLKSRGTLPKVRTI